MTDARAPEGRRPRRLLRSVGMLFAAVVVLLLWQSPAEAQVPPANWQFGGVPGDGVPDVGSASVLYGTQSQVFFESRGDLRQAFRASSGAWQTQVLDGAGGDGGRIDGEVGAGASATPFGNQLQVFYVDSTNGRLRQAFWSPTTGVWRFVDLDGPGVAGGNGRSANQMGGRTSTVIFRGGPHVFYADITANTLRHAWWDGTAWSFETLDGAGGPGGRVSGSVGPYTTSVVADTTLSVFYRYNDALRLRTASVSGPSWTFTDLDGPGVAGGNGRQEIPTGEQPNAVVFDTQPHVFYRSGAYELRHGWRSPSGAWNFQTLMTPASCPTSSFPAPVVILGIGCAPGASPAVVVYGGGPQVFHHDEVRGTLLQSWWTGTAWQQRLLDGENGSGASGVTTNSVGASISVLNAPTGPQVQYRDATTSTMRSGRWGPVVPGMITPPVIAGAATVGTTLSATAGTWNGNPTVIGYQWQRCSVIFNGSPCSDIANAIASSYTATDSDQGFALQVVVTATNAAGSTVAYSSQTARVQVPLRNVVQVSTGLLHSCAVLTDGTVRCWGWNPDGQLGDGTTVSSPVPVAVKGITNAVEVAAGDNHTCARLADKTLRCWGWNTAGELGDGTTVSSSVPVVVAGITNASNVAAGILTTCAQLDDGTLRCWGYGVYGELGNGTDGGSSLVPVPVSDITTAVDVTAGANHFCARLADKTLRCWGLNDFGQLGDGTETNASAPVTVSGISDAAGVSASGGQSCALLDGGALRCWGVNDYGQLGNGTTTKSSLPVPVSGITTAVEVAAGGDHACARLADGTSRCWGFNNQGQLGDGTYGNSTTPVAVVGITTATQMSAGREGSCTLLADTTVRCWGTGYDGALGNGGVDGSAVPVVVGDPPRAPQYIVAPAVSGSVGVGRELSTTSGVWTGAPTGYTYQWQRCDDAGANCVDVASATNATYTVDGADAGSTLRVMVTATNAIGSTTEPSAVTSVVSPLLGDVAQISGGYYHSCARLADATLRCWGLNIDGQLGSGSSDLTSSVPVTVSGITNAVEVAAGGFHTCARLDDGTVRCWGLNRAGQLGDGTTTGSAVPVTVAGITNAVEVTAGYLHSCARLVDNTLRCWGFGNYGQLGDGTSSTSTTPVAVTDITDAVEVSAGGYATCARLVDGTLRCWGYNDNGQLGDGSFTQSPIPVTVANVANAVEVSVGNYHACARLGDGTLLCWGANDKGQLGNTTFVTSPVAVPVAGVAGAVEVAAGGFHSCARLADATLRCWGFNGYGELGDGSLTDSPVPVTVTGVASAAQVSAGGYQTCARLDDATARCWGIDNFGQLGDGLKVNSSTPVGVVASAPPP